MSDRLYTKRFLSKRGYKLSTPEERQEAYKRIVNYIENDEDFDPFSKGGYQDEKDDQ
jgi:hypothetical protein